MREQLELGGVTAEKKRRVRKKSGKLYSSHCAEIAFVRSLAWLHLALHRGVHCDPVGRRVVTHVFTSLVFNTV